MSNAEDRSQGTRRDLLRQIGAAVSLAAMGGALFSLCALRFKQKIA